MKKHIAVAAFAALVGVVAAWHGSPAGAEIVVAQASPSPAASPAASPSPSPTPTPVPKAFSISGFGDIGFTSVSNASAANQGLGPAIDPQGSAITGRVFDTDNNRVQFHNFNIQAAYAPQAGFGAKLEYSFANDAAYIHSYPQSLQAPPNEVDMTQAYVSYLGGPFTVIVGKFETLAGAEVIESPSDLNFSRSILFGYAVPFTHTGGRITYAVNGNLNIIAGANQGWDTTRSISGNGDSNGLTAEYALAWTPSKAFAITAQGYTGQVIQGAKLNPSGTPNRTLTDFVATWHVNPAFTAILNGDFATQSNTLVLGQSGAPLTNAAGAPIFGNVSWDGAALYLSYTQGLFTLTGRGEYFADIGGARTGADRRWEEGTVTLQYAPGSNLIFRGEYRYDSSNHGYFLNSSGTFSNNTSGVGVEAIVKWP